MAQQFEDLPYPFTRDELRQLGEDLARANQKVYTLRGDKKTTVASLEAAIKLAEHEAAALTQKINEKSELRSTEVAYLLDTPRIGMKTLQRLDTQEEVRVEGMTEFDRQTSLAFSEEFLKAEEPPDGKSAGAGARAGKSRRSN